MGARQSARNRFLAGHGLAAVEVTPLAADASFRRYFRVHARPQTLVLMDAPPPHENVARFAAVARHLRGLGLRAPQVKAVEEGEGFALLEDFGDQTFTRVLADAGGETERQCYAAAVEVLAHLHRHPQAAAVAAPVYGDAMLLDEALLLADWYYAAAHGKKISAAKRGEYVQIWRAIFAAMPQQESTLVLRDFHVDNLVRLPGAGALEQCGLLDFQDAVIGGPAYDLMSLLEDARRDIDRDFAAVMMRLYFKLRGGVDKEKFRRVYDLLAAQRHCKVLGIFTRLHRRDGKPVYLRHIPRVARLLREKVESTPALAELGAWLRAQGLL